MRTIQTTYPKANLWIVLVLAVLASFCVDAADAARKIVPNDLLFIRVYNEPEMTAEKKVNADGVINYTFVKEIQVGGKTTAEVEKEIRDILDKDYFVNPEVSVEVKQYDVQYVTVTGQVGRPGKVEIPPDHLIDVVEAIGAAGDFTRLANKKDIKVRNNKTGESTKYSYDGLQKLAETGKKVILEHGDVVNVGESTF